MMSLLLVIIYVAFISLGLPDSVLGSAWPLMYGELGVPLSFVGFVSMIIAGGTIVSSLFSTKVIHKLGTGWVTLISVCMTAIALMGFAFSSSFWHLCLWAIPYGLGAGSVDAALNNFVALHYKSRHMSWLHCFWGIGATLGPSIMGLCLTGGFGWNAGYQSIGIIQIALVVCLALSMPLWKKGKTNTPTEEIPQGGVGIRNAIQVKGAKAALCAFFCYCSLEATTGLWASSYLVLYKGVEASVAAQWAALFYLGITIGRFASGFVSERLGTRLMVRAGQGVAVLGIILMLLPFGKTLTLIGLVSVGVGCAPIFPSLLHATPVHFGKKNSQTIMGMQMAAGYMGSTLIPPLFGFLAERINIQLYPFYLAIFITLMIFMTERINKTVSASVAKANKK